VVWVGLPFVTSRLSRGINGRRDTEPMKAKSDRSPELEEAGKEKTMTTGMKGAAGLAMLVAGAVGAAAVPATAKASGFYLGADAVQLATELDYGFTEKYTTQHLRVKAGYEFLDYLAVEAQLLTADSDVDFDVFGDRFELDTGTIVGVYIKPKTNFETANVYGLFGFSLWDTTYTDVGFGFQDTDAVVMFGVGIGGEFNVTRNFRFSIEAMVHAGSADYPTFFFDSVDVYSYGLAAGFNFRF
jgi:hypothetical protein